MTNCAATCLRAIDEVRRRRGQVGSPAPPIARRPVHVSHRDHLDAFAPQAEHQQVRKPAKLRLTDSRRTLRECKSIARDAGHRRFEIRDGRIAELHPLRGVPSFGILDLGQRGRMERDSVGHRDARRAYRRCLTSVHWTGVA